MCPLPHLPSGGLAGASGAAALEEGWWGAQGLPVWLAGFFLGPASTGEKCGGRTTTWKGPGHRG